MDFLKEPGRLKAVIKKYRPVILIILTGILLMSLPDHNPNKISAPTPLKEDNFEASLEEILNTVQGAGKVKILLSQKSGPETIYKSNEENDPGGYRKNTVVISDASRCEQGLIEQVYAPRYRGAVVIAEGAENARVKLALVRAVSSATGLGADRITVLKMK